MPLFSEPVAAYGRITRTEDREVALTADTATDLLVASTERKGHLVKNTGTSRINVSYGIPLADGTFTEFYKVPLGPGDTYLYDSPEIIPYSVFSLALAGSITVREMF